MKSSIRERENPRHRERTGNSTAMMAAAKIVAVVLAALLMADSCESRHTYIGMAGSPGGKYLALYYPDDSKKITHFYLFSGNAEIKTLDGALFSDELADMDAQEFLGNASSAGAPLTFSSDDKYLAYVNETTGNYETHELDLATMHSRVLFPHPAKDCSPSYSPDGKYLAFISYRSGSGQVWMWDRENDLLRQVTHDPESLDVVQFAAAGKLFLSSACCEEGGRIFDLESNETTPLPAGSYALSFYPGSGLMALGYESKNKDESGIGRLTLYDVNKRTSRELKFTGLVRGRSLPLSPDGQNILASSREAIWSVPLDGSAPPRFDVPEGLIDVHNPPFLAWLSNGKGFRLMAGSKQFATDLADGRDGLRAADQLAQAVLAVNDLAQGKDREFTAKVEAIESLPAPLVGADTMEIANALFIDPLRAVVFYAAGQYYRVAVILKDDNKSDSRMLVLYISQLDKTPQQFRKERRDFIAGLDEKSDEDLIKLMKETDFVDTFYDRQVRDLQKYMKPLIAEHLDVMACELADVKCYRKLSPPTRKIEWYIRLHPQKPMSGYLASDLASISEAYGDTAGREKFLRLAAKSPDNRLQSLSQLASSYSRHDPAVALKANETIIKEYPGTDEAKGAMEDAGKYWLKQGDDGKAYDLLSPLILDSDSAAPWQELKAKSPEDFRDLVLAKYTKDDAAKTERLAKVVDRQIENSSDKLLLDMVEETVADSIVTALSHETSHQSPVLGTLVLYCILNGPSFDTNGLSSLYFYLARQSNTTADIGSRWEGYAAAHPALTKTYAWLTLQGMLEYDQRNYAAARADFEQARAMLGTDAKEFKDEKKMNDEFILICLSRENNQELISRLAATVSKDSREVYDHTLAANLHDRPLAEVSAFYLAYQAAKGGGPASAYQLLECRASDEDILKTARDFSAKHQKSPLTAVMLFALHEYDAVIQRFPESLAGYYAMQKQADIYDANANYWLAAGLREKIVGHPLVDKEGKGDALFGLGVYQYLHARDYQKAANYLDRSWKENPNSKNGKDTLMYLAESWYELKDFAKAKQALALLDKEYPGTSDDRLDQVRAALGVTSPSAP